MSSNLVPLHVDKVTGKIVGKFTGGSIPSGGSFLYGYDHIQSIISDIWTINHNFSNSDILCQVYDTDNQLIFPDNIRVIDGNNIEIEFTSPQLGHAHIVFLRPAN